MITNLLNTPKGRFITTALCSLLLMLSVAYFILSGLAVAREKKQVDFRSFYVAVQALKHDINPYMNHNSSNVPELYDYFARDGIYSRYLYPPFFLVCVYPLGNLPYDVARTAWTYISIIVGLLTVATFTAFMPKGSRFFFFTLVAAWLFAAYPFHSHLRFGNADLFVGLFIALGMVAYTFKYPACSGALFGIAAGFKVLPGLFLLYFLLKKQWRFTLGFILSAMAGFIISAGLFGFDIIPNFLASFLNLAGQTSAEPDLLLYNQSITAFVSRFFVDWHYTCALLPYPQLASPLSKLLILAVLASAVLALWRSNIENSDSLWLSASVIAFVIILVPALSWEYRGVFLLLPITTFFKIKSRLSAPLFISVVLLFVLTAFNQYAPLPTTYPLHGLKNMFLLSIKTFLLLSLYSIIVWKSLSLPGYKNNQPNHPAI